MRRLEPVITCLLLVVPLRCTAYFDWEPVAPGIAHVHLMTAEPWNIHVLVIDLDEPEVRIRSVVKNDTMRGDGGEVVSRMAWRHGAAAAVNTDYFNMSANRHEPQGWTMTDGRLQICPGLIGPIIPDRPSLVITKNQTARIEIAQAPQPDWHNVASGMPRLVLNGVIIVPPTEVRHPRTAVGISPDARRLFLMTVDGRQTFSKGMSLFEAAAFLWKLGAWNAMNFDGGGSTTMWVQGRVVNFPSDGQERKVAGALLVVLSPKR